ncbi:MAG: extracellular solute-binding protein, partial [Bifidobacteriaceae bacterium]|nr:extracellular solute-binding protein [Bifidobacteriaceae bacterium]
MKRPLFAAVLAIGLATALTACSGGTKPSPVNEPTTSQAEGQPSAEIPAVQTSESVACTGDLGTLTMWVDQTREDALKEVIEQFHTEKCVKIATVVKNFDDLRKDFAAQVAAGQGPDITVGANDWLGEFKSNGLIAPLILGDAQAVLAPGAVGAYTADGQVYGVPYAMENIALVRNNAILTQTAASTFDELVAEAQAAGKQYSVLLQVGENGDPYHLTPLQNSFGAP